MAGSARCCGSRIYGMSIALALADRLRLPIFTFMSSATRSSSRILIVDDEATVRVLLAELLGPEYECHLADSAEAALEMIRSGKYAVVISDIDMPGMTGIEMVPKIHAIDPDTVILMVSGNLSLDYAVNAIRAGAFDYITKPFELEMVEGAVKRAIERHQTIIEKKQYEADLEDLVKQRTEELNHLIYHDSLTGLPNRALFEDRLTTAVIDARNDHELAVVLLSLDGFDEVQDNWGHGEADKMLQEVAVRIRTEVPEALCFSRFQGAHFALLLEADPGGEKVRETCARIGEAIARPIPCADVEIFLTASIGVCLFPDDGRSEVELMKSAGIALWRARENGGNQVRFFCDGCAAASESALRLEAELRKAFDRKELEVYYQPKIAIPNGAITGVEALIRWRHPERGLIPPGEFICLAEKTGLIVPLGEVVLREACRDAARWHAEGYSIDVAVNVSARQLKQGDLAERFEAIIKASRVRPELLTLEVTESSMMENADASVAILERLRTLGIRVSLDDFGTGYSSLARLKELPIDQIKIDREFVRDIGRNGGEDNAILTMAMVNLAHNLKLKVIAEGVETAAQLDFLRSIRCDEYQGFYFSRPVSALAIREFLGSQRVGFQFAHGDDLRPSILPQVGAVAGNI